MQNQRSVHYAFVGALKKHMVRSNISAYRLAKLTGLNPSSVQRILNGEVSPSLETVDKILTEIPIRIKFLTV